ncbi:hypothetical protein FRB98_002009, partial [Tulasnella sp. 332]
MSPPAPTWNRSIKLDELIHSFHPECVIDEHELGNAVELLRKQIDEAERHPGLMEKVIHAVVAASPPSLAVFVLFYKGLASSVRVYISDPMRLVKLFFPSQPDGFATSAAHRLLLVLRDFFFTVVPLYETPREFSRMHIKVFNASIAMEELSRLRLSLPVSSSVSSPFRRLVDHDDDGCEVEESDVSMLINKKKGERTDKDKIDKGHGQSGQVDETSLRALGVSVPTTVHRANTSAREILMDQEAILVQYIKLLQTDAMEFYVKAYHTLDNAAPVAYPIIRPIRGTRAFVEEAAELENQAISTSTRTFQHIRQLGGAEAAPPGTVKKKSPAGNLNAATSVVSLITKLFPHSIDALVSETGKMDGPKLVFFNGWNEDMRYEPLLFGKFNSPMELGAQQGSRYNAIQERYTRVSSDVDLPPVAILVRDETARETLRTQIGSEIGLILTLCECKALEFKDVLLYDFFADSPASASDWKVVLTGLKESERRGIPVPRFDEARHRAIESELKLLHVGLTRAREHIWLWDSSSTGDAMKVYWLSKGLIEIYKTGDERPMLVEQSTKADWGESGRLFFSQKRYPQSIFCFNKANMPLEKGISEAYLSRQQARNLLPHDLNRSAAFITSGSDFEEAAALSEEMPDQRKKLYQAAAECFAEGGCHIRAANAYYNAEEYTDATIQYRSAGAYNKAIQIILRHGSLVDSTLAKEVASVVKLSYVEIDPLGQRLTIKNDPSKGMQLFDDLDDYLAFLDDYGMCNAKLTVLESLSRYDEAAELLIQMGRDLEAINFFMKSDKPLSRERAARSTLTILWSKFYLGNIPSRQDETVQKLLKLGKSALVGRPEVDMFKILQSGTPDQMAAFGRRLLEDGNSTCALLSYDCALRSPESLRDTRLDALLLILQHY